MGRQSARKQDRRRTGAQYTAQRAAVVSAVSMVSTVLTLAEELARTLRSGDPADREAAAKALEDITPGLRQQLDQLRATITEG